MGFACIWSQTFAPVNIIPKMRNKTRNGIKLPTDVSIISPPSNGSQYNPKERLFNFCKITQKIRKKSHLINHLITSNLVSVTKDSVYKILGWLLKKLPDGCVLRGDSLSSRIHQTPKLSTKWSKVVLVRMTFHTC